MSNFQAANGRLAVDKFAAKTRCECRGYKLILMDIDMPEMSGLEATQAIRQQDALVPIVAVSAFTSPADVEACLQAGMNDHSTLTSPLCSSQALQLHLSHECSCPMARTRPSRSITLLT